MIVAVAVIMAVAVTMIVMIMVVIMVMGVVAALAIVINGIAAAVLARANKDDINVHGAFLHLVADAAVSAGVVVAGLIILLTGWLWVDPVASLLISAVIVWSTWGLLREYEVYEDTEKSSALDKYLAAIGELDRPVGPHIASAA